MGSNMSGSTWRANWCRHLPCAFQCFDHSNALPLCTHFAKPSIFTASVTSLLNLQSRQQRLEATEVGDNRGWRGWRVRCHRHLVASKLGPYAPSAPAVAQQLLILRSRKPAYHVYIAQSSQLMRPYVASCYAPSVSA